MTARPPAIVVRHPAPVPSAPRGWTATSVGQLPEEPFAIEHLRLAVTGDVSGAGDAAAYLLAAARGAAVVIRLRWIEPEAEQFLDDLGRLSDLGPVQPQRLGLTEEHRCLLDALADGLTLTVAANRLGLSRRTATRRLTEARELLGAGSTVEALRLHGERQRSIG